jgi:hypothetical protein
MRRPCYPSDMLPNEIIGITSWLVMSRDFSWKCRHVACGLCREITWSQSRDLIFRAKKLYLRSCGTRATSMLSTNSQMIPKWTANILWQTYWFHLNKRSFLEEGRRIRNNLWFFSIIAQFTQVRRQQSGWKSMACAACHTCAIRLVWPPVTSTYFR